MGTGALMRHWRVLPRNAPPKTYIRQNPYPKTDYGG